MSKIKNAVILAAGKSTRYGSNKLIDCILGKNTVQYCVEFCISNNIENIYVTINKSDFFFKDNVELSHPIIESLSYYNNKVNIYYEFQNENEYGPGAAIKVWDGIFYDSFLCLFGDNYYSGHINFDELDDNITYISYKDYDIRPRNLQLATIIDNVVIEKPHGVIKGRYFCGYMIFPKEVFNKLYQIKLSNRNEYEITSLINSMDNVKLKLLDINWYDLTYEYDKKIMENLIKNKL